MAGQAAPAGQRAGATGRARSLRARIVTSVVLLFACLLTLSGAVTLLALQRALVGQLDSDARAIHARQVDELSGHGPGGSPTDPRGTGDATSSPPRRPPGGGDRALQARVTLAGTGSADDVADASGDASGDGAAGSPMTSSVSTEDGGTTSLTAAETTSLLAALEDGDAPLTVDLGDRLGSYRLLASEVPAQGTGTSPSLLVTGLPLAGVDASVRSAALILVPLALVSVALAGVGADRLVRRSLAPLDRVAGTALRVGSQELGRGDVAVPDRVELRDTDPRTEVGQVGQALNSLLDTMESALAERHASEQRVRQFVADASHELRTPLASIRGYAELSRRQGEQVPETVRHALGRVEGEAIRMQGLVEDLLLLARLDAGRPLARENVDLTRLCLDAVSDARVAGAGHRWALELPGEPVEVVGDEARLRQVLANLLTNARTHTPAGTLVTTTLSLGAEDAQGAAARPRARLVVRDDGPGLPEHLRGQVFERFTRGDDSRSRAAGSTGLGLSIVRAVARAHGGEVEVTSVPGATEFAVELPVDGPVGEAEAAGRPPEHAADHPSDHTAGSSR